MINDIHTARKVAHFLLEKKAIILRPDQPFTWASGWKSPIYCDNRVMLSFPDARTCIKESFAGMVKERFPALDAVVGVATAGIAHAALVGDHLGLPMAYARSAAKDHGTKSLIEGRLDASMKVVVIEDLISTGKSSIEVVKGIKSYGYEVIGMGAIFSYDFPVSVEAAANEGIIFYTLTDYNVLIEVALEMNYIRKEDLELLKSWRKSPDTWGK